MVLLKDKLKTLREEHHLLQRQVAAALCIDNALYNKIEKGERPIKEDTLKALAIFYGVDFNELRRLWKATLIYSHIENEPEAVQILNIASEYLVECPNLQKAQS